MRAREGPKTVAQERRDKLIRELMFPDPCPDCDGKGRLPWKHPKQEVSTGRCKTCKGSGKVYRRPKRPAVPPAKGDE